MYKLFTGIVCVFLFCVISSDVDARGKHGEKDGKGDKARSGQRMRDGNGPHMGHGRMQGQRPGRGMGMNFYGPHGQFQGRVKDGPTGHTYYGRRGEYKGQMNKFGNIYDKNHKYMGRVQKKHQYRHRNGYNKMQGKVLRNGYRSMWNNMN